MFYFLNFLRLIELYLLGQFDTVAHKSSWPVVSMKPLDMQLKIQNDESSLQIWHAKSSSSCVAVAIGLL